MVLHSFHKSQYKRDAGLETAELTAVRFVFRILFTPDNWKDKSAESGGRRETFLNLKDENREKVTVKEERNNHYLGPGRVSEIFCNSEKSFKDLSCGSKYLHWNMGKIHVPKLFFFLLLWIYILNLSQSPL